MTFHPNDAGSDPDDVYSFYSVQLLEKNEKDSKSTFLGKMKKAKYKVNNLLFVCGTSEGANEDKIIKSD